MEKDKLIKTNSKLLSKWINVEIHFLVLEKKREKNGKEGDRKG